MITGLARLALAAEALVYGAIGFWLHARGWPLAAVVAAALAASLALRLGFVTGSMLLAGHAARGQPAHRRLSAAAALRLLFEEFGAVVRITYVNLPFEGLVLPAEQAPEPSDRTPVVLVHGYFSNRGYFAHLLPWLESRGVGPVFAPNFPGTFASVEEFAGALAAAIERICEGTRQPQVVLVCHSLGGLAARHYLATRGSARVARLVTIASPHAGTALARFGAGTNARQMRPGSSLLVALAAREKGASVAAASIYSLHDNLVSPQEGSRLPWARNIAVPGVGHIAILASPKCLAALLEELRTAGAAPAEAAA